MAPTDTDKREPKVRTERIDLRVDAEVKALFVRARGQRLVEEHERFVLSNRARDRFLNVLANPPAPSAALRQAARKHAAK